MQIYVRTDIDELTRDVWEFCTSTSGSFDAPLNLLVFGHYTEKRKSPRARKWERTGGWHTDAQRYDATDRRGPTEIPEVPRSIADRAIAQLIARTVFVARDGRMTPAVIVEDEQS